MATPDLPKGASLLGQMIASAPTPLKNGVHLAKRTRLSGHRQEVANKFPHTDVTGMAGLIESCRTHTVSMAELAGATSQVLSHCYEYEEHEPHLGQCCELVQQSLAQIEAGLLTLDASSQMAEPQVHAPDISTECELQLRSLMRIVHVVRAISEIFGTLKLGHPDQVLLALYDLESGIGLIIEGLRKVTRP